MDLQPYGPLEQAMTASAIPSSPNQNTYTGFFWGLLAGLVLGGIIVYITAVKKSEQDKGKTN